VEAEVRRSARASCSNDGSFIPGILSLRRQRRDPKISAPGGPAALDSGGDVLSKRSAPASHALLMNALSLGGEFVGAAVIAPPSKKSTSFRVSACAPGAAKTGFEQADAF